jgi:hypothetical protein
LKARLFLANAYIRASMAQGQYLPIKDEDTPLLAAALGVYREVLDLDPRNTTAMLGIVSLYGPGHGKEARDLMLKLISLDPGNKEAYYTLGVLDWGIAYAQVRDTLKAVGDSPAVAQISDPAARAAVRPLVAPYLEEGFRVLQVVLDKDPASVDAMAYLNLLHRISGLVADDPKVSAAEQAEADDWVRKALDARRAQAAQPKPADALDLNAEPPVVVPAPPPPPPPPPPGTAPKPRNPAEGGR